MSNKHEFLLPDELGWECNDEISKMMHEKFKEFANLSTEMVVDGVMLSVLIAELTDEMYAIIKKYQSKKVKAIKK